MSARKKHQTKPEGGPGESDDDFQYEEVSLADDWSLTDGEEDLETTVKAIQTRAEAEASADESRVTHRPRAVDDFLRDFLLHMCMTETLDCFQAECAEMLQKGPVHAGPGPVPDVHAANQRLDAELQSAQREGEEYRRAASAGAETLARVRRERDFHRLQHQRVVQEKNKVIEEIRKLKLQCDHYEPALKRMNEKYQAVLKQTMLVTLERDEALVQAGMPCCGEAGEPKVKGSTHPVIQPRPPAAANSPRGQTRVKAVKAHVC